MNNKIPYSPQRLDATRFFEKTFPKYLAKRKNLIDIGCGKLYFFDMLPDLKFKGNYLGIDIEPQKPNKLPKDINVKIQKNDILDFKTVEKFDVAVCLWVLEHIRNDNLAIERIAKLLKSDAVFVVAVPSVWSWPFELGRHGFHYYSKPILLSVLKSFGFEKKEEYNAGGFGNFLFMLLYSWPRYLLLMPLFIIHKFLTISKLIDDNWKTFSTNFMRETFYRYHNSKNGIAIHNAVADKICRVDKYLKIFPASYILILKKV